MAENRREVEHEIQVAAPAAQVYELIANVTNWPRIFPPTIYVDHLERDAGSERIRIWATANGTAKTWTSHRVLDSAARRIRFQQEISAPPVASMGGTWIVEPLAETESRVRLLHDYRAIDDKPDDLEWIDQAVDRNSRSELAALKENVELASRSAALTRSFEDSVHVDGSAKDVYEFINEANLWADRLPHVASVRLDEEVPGLQTLEMDTRAKDGSVHTTKSYRVCFPHHRIAYKQVTLPALLSLHTGRWTFQENQQGVTATSQHTITLNSANIAAVLGPGTSAEQALEWARGTLSANSLATLGHAKDYAERKG
jgi:aromatase